MNNKGVTLVELIIVIVIIGLISAFVVPAVGNYLETASKSKIYNDALLIENSAKSYCLENECTRGEKLTATELNSYMSSLKSDYEYTVTKLDNGEFGVSYYKEGDYSFPFDSNGELIDELVPSLSSSDFVNKYGVASSGNDNNDPEIPEEDPIPEGVPYVKLQGNSTIYVEYGSSYSEPGYNAYASDGSSISNKWSTGNINTWGFGTKTIVYSCYSQVDQGYCQETTRYVTIVDTTPPKVTVNGNSTIYVSLGSNYTDYQKAWAYDLSGTQSAVTSTSNVDTSKKGTYYVTYSSTDSSGNTGTARRKVIVN